jgi:hypothetical protein
MKVEEIEEVLTQIGFEKRMNGGREISQIYVFCHEDFEYDYDTPISLYISFEDYNDVYYVHFNAHNIHDTQDILKLTKESFVENLDMCVLATKNSFVYESRSYMDWFDKADEQREIYFENRKNLDIALTKKVKNHIKKHGLSRWENPLEKEYNGKQIGDMSWEDLANTVLELMEKKNVSDGS